MAALLPGLEAASGSSAQGPAESSGKTGSAAWWWWWCVWWKDAAGATSTIPTSGTP
jgi:hypothetical protein